MEKSSLFYFFCRRFSLMVADQAKALDTWWCSQLKRLQHVGFIAKKPV
jgi:hypothetical protein